MKKEHLEILAKIIGGVESGGQIYGGQNYAAYAGKAANSANEKTWMGAELWKRRQKTL